MTKKLTGKLDLELAWKRVKDDTEDDPVRRRVFIKHPYEIKLIEINLTAWLKRIREQLEKDKYEPKTMLIADIPKGKGTIRPGGHLSMEDRLVFYAVMGELLPKIILELSWSQGVVDFCYQFAERVGGVKWFKSRFKNWEGFRKTSLEKIGKGVDFVVFSDISAYYENIDIGTLISDLSQIGGDEEAVTYISKFLNKWAQVRERGIPQGYSPADILGKLYLNSVDRNMAALGYDYIRFVDDIRIFCENEPQAKQALIYLIRLLRSRGLAVQTAKTQILKAEDAKKFIEGEIGELKKVLENFQSELSKFFIFESPYFNVNEADEKLAEEPHPTVLSILKEAYQNNFIDRQGNNFDKSLFHFLLNRLGKQKDAFAVEHCKNLFVPHPEETHAILNYFSSVGFFEEIENDIVNFLNSADAIYDYQIYQIIEWLSTKISYKPSLSLLNIVRKLAFDPRKPTYLRSYCKKYLGNYGLSHDLERLENSYKETSDVVERADIICSLKRLEKRRRNSFYSRVSEESDLNMRAVELVKKGAI